MLLTQKNLKLSRLLWYALPKIWCQSIFKEYPMHIKATFMLKKPEYKSIKDWQCAVVMSMDTSSSETDDGRPNIIVVHTKAALSKLFRFVPPTFRKAIRKLLQNFVAFCTMGVKISVKSNTNFNSIYVPIKTSLRGMYKFLAKM